MSDQERTPKYVIIQWDTGEQVNIAYDGDIINVIRKYLPEEAPKGFKRSAQKYLKLNQTALPKLQKLKLSPCSWSIFWLFCENLRYSSCEVRRPNGRHISLDYVSEAVGYERRTVQKAIRELHKNGIVCKLKDSPLEIYINPYCLSKGSKIKEDISILFQGTIFYEEAAENST